MRISDWSSDVCCSDLSSPPCTLGCSVLTRPSIISGKPVWSDTSFTASPASRSALAVPPVDSSSTPCRASACPSATSPVLSDTESSARVTLTPLIFLLSVYPARLQDQATDQLGRASVWERDCQYV